MLRGAAALELKGQLPCKQAAQDRASQGRLRSQEHLPEPETYSEKENWVAGNFGHREGKAQ
jgi:hypothetical protein